MGTIIKRIFTFLILPAAIVYLAYLNYETISKPMRFTEDVKSRETVAIGRLKDLCTLQLAFRDHYGHYAQTLDSLTAFYTEGKVIATRSFGNVDDSVAVAKTDSVTNILKRRGVKQKDMPKALEEVYRQHNDTLPLIFSIESEWPVKELIFTKRTDFIVDSIIYIPYSGGKKVLMKSAVTLDGPLFEACVPYKYLLKGLDKQLVINEIAKRYDLGLYPGLKLGDVEKNNNNAGNWE